MCKIFTMTNMANVDLESEFLETVRDAVCKHNDRDGFGYATVSDDGTLFGERTTNPLEFVPLANDAATSRVHALPIVAKSSNSFGARPNKQVKAFIAHGRMSTNTVSIDNTHPLTNGNVALIHNGVVSDPTNAIARADLKTDCDSEILLRLWEAGGMRAIEDNTAGYYAIAILDSKGLLHVARDDRASLVIAYSPTVDSFLMATTAEIILDIATDNDWELGVVESVQDNTYAVFDGNSLVDSRTINPIGYAKGISNAAASRALGDMPRELLDSPVEALTCDDRSALREYWDARSGESYDDLSDDDGPAYRESYSNRRARK